MQYRLLLALLLLPTLTFAAAPGSIPILYTTDLLHPHSDPDDHYDLATLFALPEFDIRGLVFDLGEKGKGKAALASLRQMMHLTQREIPWAEGLLHNLASPEDTGEGYPEEQAGIRLILDTLRASVQPVTLFVTGSLRDIAAAYNQAPDLFKEKAGRLYINAGSVNDKVEWNVGLDLNAYLRIMRSGLPIYWAPCFGNDGYETYWRFTQSDVLDKLDPPLQQFFIYMLEKAGPGAGDPIAFLDAQPAPAARATYWPQPRNMWCTAPLLHAAGRPIPHAAFLTRPVTFHDDGLATLDGEISKSAPVHVFHIEDAEHYPTALTAILAGLLQGLKVQ